MSRIAAIRIDPYALPLARPWRTAAGTLSLRRGWRVRAEDGDGGVGLGDEPAPLPDQEMEEGGRRLHRQAALCLGRAPEAALADCDGIPIGLETALLDLAARRRGLPVRRLLAPEAGESVKVNGISDLGGVLPLSSQGFDTVKIKVGLASWSEEAAALRALSLPPGLTLRLDANRAWSGPEAAAFLSAIAGLPVESLEEPLRAPDIAALAALQSRTAIALAIDESLEDLGFEALVAFPPVRRLVLKPARLGGLRRTLRMAVRAEAAGFETIITSYLDSAIGVAAAAHLAAAVDPSARRAHGLATTSAFAADLAVPLPIRSGRLFFSGESGLGLDAESATS